MWTGGEKVPPLEINEFSEGAPSTNPPPSSSMQIGETCEDHSGQLIDYETIMLKNQMDLKKKEQEVQEYVEKLTKIKSKVKLSRRSIDNANVGQSDSIQSKKPDDGNEDNADDGGDENDDIEINNEKAKTPKARSHLLQKKLAENRRIFQQRNKEMFESTRAVEEKVEKIKLQINESAEKDRKNIELNEKIHELQATIIDLQDNLKEKDSVIESKTRAITLMSEDLSRKGKTTLDVLEETKSEMRLMQENFIQSELSLKTKIEHLVNQLTEKEHYLETLQHENESINLTNAQKEEKIIELEAKTQELIDLMESKKLEESSNEENEKILKLFKQELEDSNKNMIKMKSQHKNKLRNLQKRLESFRTMSDTHAEVMRLENQVALLEEEKGNLQLSLVDFDELKASNEELQRRLNELKNQTVTQTNEIQKHIEAIAALENQKLDLIQELHEVKQEMIALENENSESENLRVTAELKIVELEEQLEKLNSKKVGDDDNAILIEDSVESGNNGGIDKKSTESSGSSESFERITDVGDGANAHLAGEIAAQSNEISQLNEKILILTDENSELVITLTKLQEKMSEAEKSRDNIEQLKIENDKLLEDNRKNVIDNQTLMSLEAEIVNLKQLLSDKNGENEKLINDSILNRENIHSLQADLAETISALQSKLIDEHANVESLKKLIDEKIQLINELENEKSQNDEKMNQLEMERNKLSEFIEEKMSLHNNLEQKLLQKIEKLEIEVENRNVIMENLKEESTKIQREFERMGNLSAECSTEQANQAAMIERLGAQNEEFTVINSSLNQEIYGLKENMMRTIKKMENTQLKCDEYIQEIENKNAVMTELELKLNNAHEDHSVYVDSLKGEFEKMNLHLNEKIVELEEKIVNFQGELQQKDEMLNELMAKNAEISTNNEVLRENIKGLMTELNNLNAEIAVKDEVITKKFEEVTNLENELQVESDKNMKQLLLLEQSNRDLEERWQEIQVKYEEKSNSYEDLLLQIENQSKCYEEIKEELSNSYRTLEQLKMKHQEDVEMLNQRFEGLLTDFNDKMRETDELKIIINKQEKIIDSNLTYETKNSLEERISCLERDLQDANSNTQAQLHKMRIIAANLKRKSAQCHELEMKLRETEEKWTLDKQEKEILNEKIQSLDKIKEENDEMIKKLELNLDNAELEIQNGKKTYEDLMLEHESYKEKSSIEIAEKNRELMEVKEKARELDVRMQVMEAEYLEQLNTIHRSETEHRLLLSKLSQVNELLEYTKNESAELRNNQVYLRTEIDEVKREKDNEANEKTKVINELISELDQYGIKIEELTIELNKIRSENEELTNKHEELTQQIEIMTTNQNIDNNKSPELIPPIEKTTEVLFDASQCFGTSLNMDMSDNNEIANLKKLLDTQKNQQQLLESENERLNSELNSLKMRLSDLVAESDENNVKIEHYECHNDGESHEEMKLDEEWIWNANEAEHPDNIQQLHPFSSKETQLSAKIAELEDTIKDITDEKLRLSEELKLIQIKNGKLIRKLKEYKVQSESLQQQLKIQLSSGGLSDLDSAIEEELRSQVSQLEKILIEIKNENEKLTLERDQCTKKIDVLMAGNERFVDLKERQDRDLEVMHIRNNELMKKIELLEMKMDSGEEKSFSDDNVNTRQATIDAEECKKCLGKISELRENVDMLAVENDELRKLIETERSEFAKIKHKVDVDKQESEEELKSSFYEMLEKSHNLEKQCLDTLEETNVEKNNLEKNNQMNLMEASEKINELQNDILQKEMMIKNLETTVENCQVSLNDKLEKLEEANQKIRDIEIKFNDEIASRQMTIQALEKTVEDSRIILNEKIQELEDANKKIGDIDMELENERDAKRNEIRVLQATQDDLRNNLNKLTEELSITRKKFQDMETTLNNEITTKQLEINTLQENFIINYDKLNEQTEISSELQRQLDEMKDKLGANLEKCEEDLEDKNEKSIAVKLEHDLLVIRSDEKIRELDNRITESRNELAEKDSTLKLIEVNLETALKDGEKWYTEYKEIAQKLAEVNENLGTVTELLNVRVQEVAELKQYIQKLEFDKLDLENCNMDKQNLNRQLIAKDNELASVTSKYEIQLDGKLKETSNLHSEILALTSQCDESTTKLNNQAQEIDSLKASVNNSELLITTLTTQISSKDETISQLEKEIVNSNNEIQRLSAVLAELETSNLHTRTDLDTKLIELKEKSEEMYKLQSDLTENISIRQHENDEHKLIEKQLNEQLSAKNEEIDDFKYILDASTYPLIIQQLQDKIDQLYEEKSQLAQLLSSNSINSSAPQSENVKLPEQSDIGLKNSNELDVALYMLHQRDVKCEELTHELMQLLEERDTLQLRLSNAIRVNEELRRLSTGATSKHEQIVGDGDSVTEDGVTTDGSDPRATISTIQPTDSEEGTKLLTQKLSQLRNVGHRRDIRLLDDRELRNTQQMSLIAHKDALSTLPPDAAARLINANYTLSRDVQSQSSVLLNWLWGKSTPKVVDM